MKLFSLPNLTSHSVSIADDVTLSTAVNPRPGNLDKKQYNDWCRASSTQSNFISAWEGLNPQGRVVAQNPGRLLHGIIADYDNPNATSLLQDLPKNTGHLPTWVIDSFTPGKCRLIWPFEVPVNAYNPELTKTFLKVLNEKIKISEALPGFDESSWKDTQYFEMGTNWRNVTGAAPIPEAVLLQCMMEAGMRKPVESGDVEIPMDVVAEEVEKRWPGRWPVGNFMEGAVGPLFWVEPFVNHRSCSVAANGMICYSDRAASNFMPWRAIFGNKFVEKYELDRAAKLADMFWFDGNNYWSDRNTPGFWRTVNRTDAQIPIKKAGCNPRPKKGQQVSEVEEVLNYIQEQRRVNCAVPLLFESEKLVEYNGKRLLNISSKQVMQPAESGDPEQFPWIYDFVMNAFDGAQSGVPAKEYFIAWFKRFYESSYQQDPQQGQSIVIAGEAHAGKSFFANWIIGKAMGGSCDASDILLGNTKFNENAAHNAVWLCDDAVAQGDLKTRQELALRLKAMAAKPMMRYEPKFVNAVDLPFKGRVIVCGNIDPESLRILPTMDGTIKDKIMLFRIDPKYRPHFFNKNSDNESRAVNELPFFLRWILNYEVDSRVVDRDNTRFSVKSFHHPTLVLAANVEQPEARLAEIISLTMETIKGDVKKGAVVTMTSTEFCQAVHTAQLNSHLQQLGGIRNVGKLLHKVVEQKLSPFLTQQPKVSGGYHKYTFDPHAEDITP
jgi:hypothetical protein